ncbi:unnamed protein product, partial [Mesorhabditis spiculigera]
MSTIEEQVAAILGDSPPAKLEDLLLDNVQATDGKISGIPEGLVNLENLSLVNCGLTSLEGLPYLPKLKRLDLSHNASLANTFDVVTKQCPELGALVLSECKIADLAAIEELKGCKVETLDLYGNPVASVADYRNQIFKLLPELKYLDGINQEGENLEESDLDDEDDEEYDSEDEDGPGLSFLQNSHLVDEEDESEDYDPSRGKKRGHSGAGDEEDSNEAPATKK